MTRKFVKRFSNSEIDTGILHAYMTNTQVSNNSVSFEKVNIPDGCLLQVSYDEKLPKPSIKKMSDRTVFVAHFDEKQLNSGDQNKFPPKELIVGMHLESIVFTKMGLDNAWKYTYTYKHDKPETPTIEAVSINPVVTEEAPYMSPYYEDEDGYRPAWGKSKDNPYTKEQYMNCKKHWEDLVVSWRKDREEQKKKVVADVHSYVNISNYRVSTGEEPAPQHEKIEYKKPNLFVRLVLGALLFGQGKWLPRTAIRKTKKKKKATSLTNHPTAIAGLSSPYDLVQHKNILGMSIPYPNLFDWCKERVYYTAVQHGWWPLKEREQKLMKSTEDASLTSATDMIIIPGNDTVH